MLDIGGKPLVGDKTISPKTRERIKTVQKRLDDAGVKDIKIAWNYDQMSIDLPALDDVANKVCKMLESHLDGEGVELGPVGDSHYNGDDGPPFDEQFHQQMIKEFGSDSRFQFTEEQRERIEDAFDKAIAKMNANLAARRVKDDEKN